MPAPRVDEGWVIEEGWIIGDVPIEPTFLVTQFDDFLITEFNDFIVTED